MDFKMNQSVEAVDIIQFINRKKKLHQKLLLNAVEEVMDLDSMEYKLLRKSILDNTNDFSRSIVRAIFGDTFEGLIK